MKNKLIISIIFVLVLIGGVAYFLWDKSVEEQKVQEQELAYQKEMVETLGLIDTSTTSSVLLAATYQEYWGAIIDRTISFSTLSKALNVEESILSDMTPALKKGYTRDGMGLEQGEFDIVISMVRLAKEEETNLVLANQESITKAMADLKNPPEKFKNNYDSLLEVYEVYDTFISLSTSPSGSYIEYSKNINSTFESLSSKIKTVKLQIN